MSRHSRWPCALGWIGFLGLLALWILILPATAHTVLRDLEYARVDGISLLLDLYLPEAADDRPVPLVIWVHGGGWKAGSKNSTYAPETLGESYAVASVDYRLSGIATFPAQIHDVKAAVRWLRAHAETYGLDSDRFGAWGSSAGGHLVTLLGTTCGHPVLEGDLGDHLDVSSCVQAVCDFFGPTDLLAMLEQRGEDVRRPMPEDELLGELVERVESLARLASPITHVHDAAPPFLIMHGTEDRTVSVDQSTAFHEALLAAGVPSTLRTIEGAGHGFPREHLVHVKPFFDEWLQRSEAVSDASTLSVVHRHGQSFVTWRETDSTFYAIYRTDTAITSMEDLQDGDRLAIVPTGSSRNARASAVERSEIYYIIEPGGAPLDADTGLLVYTATTSADMYYAVASCNSSGDPLAWIGSVGPVSERVAIPQPVLQSEGMIREHMRVRYAHWAPHVDTATASALCNRPYYTFDFVVWEPLQQDPGGAALFSLHGGGGTYANAIPPPTHPKLLVVSPESFIPGTPKSVDRTWDAWYGYNSHVGLDASLADGVNTDYTTRRLQWMAEWLAAEYPTVDPNRIFLRGSSMGGVGTVFSAIMLRDVFAAGLAIVPRFDYGADDVFLESYETFGTRWGAIEDNVISSDGMGVFDRLDAGYLARTHPDWSFAPVWAFNGRNDTAVGWSEKIPFYESMRTTAHGWAFYWDLRAHGGQSPDPRAWRESGWEDFVFAWMVENVRLDQSYPAFSNCTIDDDPGSGDPLDGDPVGTISGYLFWDADLITEDATHWSIVLTIHQEAPAERCYVDVTPSRLSALALQPNDEVRFQVEAMDQTILLTGTATVDQNGRVTLPGIPVDATGTRLRVARR